MHVKTHDLVVHKGIRLSSTKCRVALTDQIGGHLVQIGL